MSLTNYEILTYRDAIEHVVDVFAGQDSVPKTFRNARQAVKEAYRDLPTMRAWHYYERIEKLQTVASQSTGTVVYDHTGGAYERVVTLTGATWPTDVRYYGLLIGRDRYEIDDRKSSTEITLPEWSNPSIDVASTGYTLYRDTFPLPDYYLRMGRLMDVTSGSRILSQVTKDELLILNHAVLTTSLPHLFSIGPSPHYPGGMAITFAPSPVTARAYDAVIQSKGRPLKIEREYTGTVTISAGSTSVTGTGTAFTPDMAGSVLRVSRDTTQLPNGPRGNMEASEVDNPYAEQFVIKNYNAASGAAALTLEAAAFSAYTATKYTVSDPLDLDASTMLDLFFRLAEWKFSQLDGREDRRVREKEAEAEFLRAAASDNRNFSQPEPYRGPFRLRDLATSVNFN